MEVYDELEKALKEIERLNNIINELEEYCDEKAKVYEKQWSKESHAMSNVFKHIVSKIKKLKGEDKE